MSESELEQRERLGQSTTNWPLSPVSSRCPPDGWRYCEIASSHWSLESHGHDTDWETCWSRRGPPHGYDVGELMFICMHIHSPPTHTHTHAHIQTGLANRVVPKGKSLEEALKLANQIAEFPQQCLRADRRSAYCAMYRSQGFLRSLGYEHRLGTLVLHEARAGARKFVEGMGRGGNFN